VGAIYAGFIAERRRELGLLLAIGMRPSGVIRLVLVEAALTTGLGGLCGVLLGAACLLVFERVLGSSLVSAHVPFAWPPLFALAALGFCGVIASGLVGILGALVPALRAVRSEPFALVRGDHF
jgi:ABC-type antimicrobial peptide transport system permease subunit